MWKVLQHLFFLGVNEVPIFQDPAQIEKILKHARIFHCFELPYMTCTFDKSTEFMDLIFTSNKIPKL
jgi:hypothetical protein